MGILPAVVIAALAISGTETPREPEVILGVDSLSANVERPVRGTVSARCGARGSVVDLDLAGLEPDGRYSVWVFVFDRPNEAVTPSDAVAAGALGGHSSRHEFVADPAGRARVVVLQRAGPLTAFGSVRGCLLDAAQWRLVGGLHPRGIRAGVYMPARGEIVEQFGITYRKR